MARRRKKSEKLADCFDAFRCIRDDIKVKRSGAKDGSVPTHPVMPLPHIPEASVSRDCGEWFRVHGVMMGRNNTGAGAIGSSGFYVYGIKDGGDWIGLRKDGIHLEVECKKGKGGRLSPGQQQRWRDVEANNGIYLIIHGLAELEYYKEFILI